MHFSLVSLVNVVTIIVTLFSLHVFLVPVAFAQGATIPLGLDAGLKEGETAAKGAKLPVTGDAVAIILKVINFILKLIAIIAVLFLVIAGVIYITALGDENKAGKAKRMILYIVIGLVIIILSQLLVNLVLGLASGNQTGGGGGTNTGGSSGASSGGGPLNPFDESGPRRPNRF